MQPRCGFWGVDCSFSFEGKINGEINGTLIQTWDKKMKQSINLTLETVPWPLIRSAMTKHLLPDFSTMERHVLLRQLGQRYWEDTIILRQVTYDCYHWQQGLGLPIITVNNLFNYFWIKVYQQDIDFNSIKILNYWYNILLWSIFFQHIIYGISEVLYMAYLDS